MRIPLVFLLCTALFAKITRGDTSVRDLLSSEDARSLGAKVTKKPINGNLKRVRLPKYAAPDKISLGLWPRLGTLDSTACTGAFIEVAFRLNPPTPTDPYSRIFYQYQGARYLQGVSQADCTYRWVGSCCIRDETTGLINTDVDEFFNNLGFKVPTGAITFAPDGFSFRVQTSIPIFVTYLIFEQLPNATMDIDITVGCTAGVLVGTEGLFTCNTKPPDGGDYLGQFGDATMEGHMSVSGTMTGAGITATYDPTSDFVTFTGQVGTDAALGGPSPIAEEIQDAVLQILP